MDRTHRLREGSIPRLLLEFSLPAIVGLMAQAMYNFIDRLFISWALGKEGIAGITTTFPFVLILLAFGMLLGFGATALISIRLGQQKKEDAELILGNVMVLLPAASILVTLLAWIFLDRVLIWMGTPDSILPYAHDYMEIIALGSIFQIVSFGLNSVIRGEGNPRTAMMTMLISVALNAIFAPIFIFVFHWGMRGAALATVLAQAVAAVWVTAYFFRSRSLLKVRFKNLRLKKSVCFSILAVGSPMFAMQIASSVMQSIMLNQLKIYGARELGKNGSDNALAVWGIFFVMAMMFFMPIFGINQGAQPIMGYNHGARQFDRVRKALRTAVLAATCVAVAGFLLLMIAPGLVIALFDTKKEIPLSLGVHAMRTCVIMMPTIGFQVVSASYFQAVGKPRQAMFLSLSRQVLFLIPAVLILPRFFGLAGVWAALPTADSMAALCSLLFLSLELRHLRRKVEKGEGRGKMLSDE